jgi:hypothetical protein
MAPVVEEKRSVTGDVHRDFVANDRLLAKVEKPAPTVTEAACRIRFEKFALCPIPVRFDLVVDTVISIAGRFEFGDRRVSITFISPNVSR